jgi:hypothetical protein
MCLYEEEYTGMEREREEYMNTEPTRLSNRMMRVCVGGSGGSVSSSPLSLFAISCRD